MDYNNNINYSEEEEDNYQSSIQEPNNNNNNEEAEFLEISLIPEIIHSLKQIEKKIPSLTLEEIINERIRQLAYCEVLVNIYNKDISYIIKSHMNLGIAYYEKKLYSQALEHLLKASKYNEGNNLNEEDNKNYNKEYKHDLMQTQIKIFIYLAKCYLENDRCDVSIQIADKCLKMNKKLFKDEFHISNADIYYLKVQCDRKLNRVEKCIEDYKHMVEIYEKTFGIDCDKIAKICMELGDLYVSLNEKNKAIEEYKNSYLIWEKVLEKQNLEEEEEDEENSLNNDEINKKYDYTILFDICIKISNLYFELLQINDANDIFNVFKYEDKIDEINEQVKINYMKQKIKVSKELNNIEKYLEDNLKLAKIYEDSIKNDINNNDEIDYTKEYDKILDNEIKIKKKKKKLAKIYVRIGYIYNDDRIYNYDKCIEYFNKAKKLYSNIKDKNNVEKIAEQTKKIKEQVKKFNNDNKDLNLNNNYDFNNNNNNNEEENNNNIYYE